jgi:hypothetical protein
MSFIWPLVSAALLFACSTETSQKSVTNSAKTSEAPAAAAKDRPTSEIRYHCSQSASRSFAVLYMGVFAENGTAIGAPARISGMIPILECRARSRNYVRKVEQIPGSNYFCELDASGTAMLFEQSISDKLALSTKKISKAMSRKECTEAAEAKQMASGKLWQES